MRHKLYEVLVSGHKRQFRLSPTEAARLGATPIKARAKKKDKE